MSHIYLNALAPEIFLTGMACITLLADVYATNSDKNLCYWISIFALAATAFITIFTIPQIQYTIFNDSFIVDRFACGLKIVSYILLACIFIYSRYYMRARDFLTGEFFALTLF